MLRKFGVTALALVLLSALTVPFASSASADPKDDRGGGKGKPVLVKDRAATVTAGGSAWLNLLWVGDGDITDFQVRATANHGATVGYSVTTGSYAGPMNGHELLDRETDFTAIELTVPEGVTREVKLRVEATWTSNGRQQSKRFNVKVPVVQHTGNDWEPAATSVTTTGGWVEIPVAGLAPKSERVRFEVSNDGGLDLYLPQGSWTGPHHDSTLEAGESDVLRVYIEPGSASAGTYNVVFTASWARSGQGKQLQLPYTITIA